MTLGNSVYLCIIDNGFVYVGRLKQEDSFYIILNGYNVRKSGTTKGFGQLAFSGPLKESVLDLVPPVLVPVSRMCHFIECSEEKWSKEIKPL
jgi:hypothetical protein